MFMVDSGSFALWIERGGERFVGHVGGDDFFACFRESAGSAEAVTSWLLKRFRHDVRRFYDEATLGATLRPWR